MNTLKKLVICSAVSAIGLLASADVLYWQVDTSDSGNKFTSANLYATGGALGSDRQLLESVVPFDANPGSITDLTQTELGAYGGNNSSYSFFVELANYSGNGGNDYRAYTYTYDELVSAGYIASNPFDSNSAAAAAAVSNFGAPTPEPTSGMLLLIGGSLLALRRRRRQA